MGGTPAKRSRDDRIARECGSAEDGLFLLPLRGRQIGRIADLHGGAARRVSAMDGANERAEGG